MVSVKAVSVGVAGATVLAVAGFLLVSGQGLRSQTAQVLSPNEVQSSRTRQHGMVIHVNQNDAAIMKVALSSAENLMKYYEDKGEDVGVEIVAQGQGLHMLRDDTSPVKDKIAELSHRRKNVTFSGCANSIRTQAGQEHKDIVLVAQARVVPAAVGRIMELQEQGWSYIRP